MISGEARDVLALEAAARSQDASVLVAVQLAARVALGSLAVMLRIRVTIEPTQPPRWCHASVRYGITLHLDDGPTTAGQEARQTVLRAAIADLPRLIGVQVTRSVLNALGILGITPELD